MRASYSIQARTVKRFHLLQQSIPQEFLQCEHLQDLDPHEVCYQRARPRLLIGSDNWELIVSKQLLTGGQNEPAASRTELGWVIHGTASRVKTSNDDEHVFHLTAGNWTQRAKNELHDLANLLKDDSTDVALKSKAHVPIQKEDEKVATKQLKETGLLQLPRYYNTRGVRIRGRAYTAIVPLRKGTTAEDDSRRPDLMAHANPSHREPVDRLSDHCKPLKHHGHRYNPVKRPHCTITTHVENMHPRPHKQIKCTTLIRNQGGVLYRTNKKLAVLTRNMKLRDSFAEGSVEDRSIVPHTAPAVTNADWLTADFPTPRDPLTTCDRLISRSTRPYARAGWEKYI